MRVLAITNMYPTVTHPASGTFVATQVQGVRDAGVEIDVLLFDRPAQGRRAYRGLGEVVRRHIETVEPDVVHVMYGGVMADGVTRSVGDVPVLVSFCGDDLLGASGGLVTVASGRYNVLASRRAARRAAGTVVKSRNLLDALPRGVDRSRAWIVPSGVDLSRFRPRPRDECCTELGWDRTRSHVLFPAPSKRPEKRFALAEQAVGLLRGRGMDVELHALENVPHERVPVWVNAADVSLLTSAHEGSPNAVKEALACDVPVVSVDVGDVQERIAGIEGCFIAEPTAEDIADKLALVLEGGRRVEGRARAQEFSLETVTGSLLRIYSTVADGG